MLSHDNLTWGAWSLERYFPDVQPGKEILISYLPLNHMAALVCIFRYFTISTNADRNIIYVTIYYSQAIDLMFGITIGATLYVADKDALKGTLIRTLIDVQPTIFIGVPRVFEKISEFYDLTIAAKTSGIRLALHTWYKENSFQHWMDHINNNGSSSGSLQYRFARYMGMHGIREALGFTNCRVLISAAAPLSTELKKRYLSLDLPLFEGFGMSETSGGHCVGHLDNYNLTTVGFPLEGNCTKILNADGNGNGEVISENSPDRKYKII